MRCDKTAVRSVEVLEDRRGNVYQHQGALCEDCSRQVVFYLMETDKTFVVTPKPKHYVIPVQCSRER